MVEPASAPPKRYVYISTIMIGNAVTSKSCSGTCLIFSMARQPKVMRRRRARWAAAGAPLPTQQRGERLGLTGAGVSVVLTARWWSRCSCRRLVLSSCDGRCRLVAVATPCVSWLAGEGEEDLVQAGLAQREVVDGDAGRGPARPVRGRPARPRRVRCRPRADAGGQRHRVGLQLDLGVEGLRAAPARPPAAAPRHAAADARTRRRRTPSARPCVPSAMTLPWSMTAIRDAELVGLVQILRGQQHCRALGDDRPHDVPHLVAAARVEPGGRLVQEEQIGRVQDGRGDVDTAPHAARVVLHLAPGRVRQPEGLQQLRRPAPARRAWSGPSSRASSTRFSVPVRSSSTDAYCPVRLTRAAYRVRPRAPRRGRRRGPRRRPDAAGWRASSRWSSCPRRSGRGRRRRCRREPGGRRRPRPGSRRRPSPVPSVSIAGPSCCRDVVCLALSLRMCRPPSSLLLPALPRGPVRPTPLPHGSRPSSQATDRYEHGNSSVGCDRCPVRLAAAGRWRHGYPSDHRRRFRHRRGRRPPPARARGRTRAARARRGPRQGARRTLPGRPDPRRRPRATRTGSPGRSSTRTLPDRLDSLLHIAGVVDLGPVGELTPKTWRHQLNVNLDRARRADPALPAPTPRRPRPRALRQLRCAGFSANADWAAYAASKHGLKALADSLRARGAAATASASPPSTPGRTASPMQAKVHQQEGKEYDASRAGSTRSPSRRRSSSRSTCRATRRSTT